MIGQLIGHYRVLERIPGGAMGVVYRARDETLPRDVALKLLPPDPGDDPTSRQRLRQEAVALSRLNHPAVAILHEFIETPEFDCIVMEFVAGESLDATVRRGALGEHETLRLGAQMAQGLAAAHAAGIIHRDLKPGNLRVTSDSRLKILDFGLARRAPSIGVGSVQTTQTQALAGTPPYVAPELWGGAPANESSDLYAAGVVLYEMATGAHPFQALAEKGYAFAALNVPPPSTRTLNPAISSELDSVILHCLEKDPSHRMPSAKELAGTLEALHSRRLLGAGPGSTPRPTRRWPAAVALALMPAIVYAIGVGLGWWPAPGPATPIRSLGVLPVANYTGDPAQENVADGMTDGLISTLGEYPSLRVIDRTTMMTYKMSRKKLALIARELHVEAVVQGSMKGTSGRLEYSFQLYRARDLRQVWSKGYKGDLGDGPEIQNRAASAIADRIGLTGAGGDRAARSHEAVDPAAYNLYLQGRYDWNRRSEAGVRQAIKSFTLAIDKAPRFALAYSGLADAWTTAGHLGVEPPLVAYPRAKQAALRAVEIDSTLSEAYVSLGNIRQNFDWDWNGAERDFRRAIALNPSNSEAHHWYANLLTYRGDFERATTEIESAKAVDPRSLPVSIGAAALLYFARRHEDAFRAFQSAALIDSSSGLLYRAMAGNLYQMGREAETARAIQRWLENEYPGDLPRAAAHGYQRGRLPGMLRVLLGALAAERQAGRYQPATYLAELSILLGDREGAFRYLDLALAEHDSELNRLKVDPIFDPLRADPRFLDLLRKIGLGASA